MPTAPMDEPPFRTADTRAPVAAVVGHAAQSTVESVCERRRTPGAVPSADSVLRLTSPPNVQRPRRTSSRQSSALAAGRRSCAYGSVFSSCLGHARSVALVCRFAARWAVHALLPSAAVRRASAASRLRQDHVVERSSCLPMRQFIPRSEVGLVDLPARLGLHAGRKSLCWTIRANSHYPCYFMTNFRRMHRDHSVTCS